MRVSWKWLSEWIDLKAAFGDLNSGGSSLLAEFLTARGLEVEEVTDLCKGLERVITARVIRVEPHPQADRLRVCRVVLSDVSSSPVLQIVCGAPNVVTGAIVALAQVGACLPNGVKISESKIRGVVSSGMLCSAEELGLNVKSVKFIEDGVLILPESSVLGQPLAQVLGRDDVIFTLKLTANRGDCLSHLGLAREIGANSDHFFQKKVETIKLPFAQNFEVKPLKEVKQFFGCFMEGVKVGPSPSWLVQRLEYLGYRSINNVVDATNWVMLELGYPVHAYDADRIPEKKVGFRISHSGEKLRLIDGETVSLTGEEIVVTDHLSRPISLAGVMGGQEAEVSDQTCSLFLECAEFDPTWVRKTALRFKKRTEASLRFEKGIDPKGLENAISRLAYLITQWAGGSAVASFRMVSSFESPKICFSKYYIHDFLGFPREGLQALKGVKKILEGHGCEVEEGPLSWSVIPPSYRLDLLQKEDLAEEVARTLGYDQLPATLPALSTSPTSSCSSSRDFIASLDQAKDALLESGFHETIHFAFTNQDWLLKFGFHDSVKVINPLSKEHEALVPSLLPGLIRAALYNWSHYFGSEPLSLRLFEIRPIFQASPSGIKAQGKVETGVLEHWKLALLVSGEQLMEDALLGDRREVDFYDLKAVIYHLLKRLRIHPKKVQWKRCSDNSVSSFYHPGCSAELWIGSSCLGVLGLLHPKVSQEIKAKASLWLVELDWALLFQASEKVATYKAWSHYPPMERDFALLVKEDTSSGQLCELALKAGRPLAKSARVFDIYQGSQVEQGMTSIAIRVIFYNEGGSLQESQVESLSSKILEVWKKELGAQLRQ